MRKLDTKIALYANIANKYDKIRQRQKERLAEFKAGVRELQARYTEEFGLTAYTVLNIASDVASRPFLFSAASIMVDTLQKRVGGWIGRFQRASRAETFNLEKYLAEYMVLLADEPSSG